MGAAVAVVAAACTGPPTPPVRTLMPAPSDAALPTRTTDALAVVLDRWVAGRNGPGVAAAVVAQDGSWAGAAGVDGAGRPVVPESAMAVGDLTHTLVAAQVLLLADSGEVDLAAPVEDYVTLPWDARGASVRQVLAMRSGFPVDPLDTLVPSLAAEPDRPRSPAEVLAAADPRGPRAGQLGGTPFYNRLNYVVLGLLVERVTGEPLARVLRRDLLDPGGLDRLWVQDEETPAPPRAVGAGDRLGLVDPGGEHLPSRAAASALGASSGLAGDAPAVAAWGYRLYGGHAIDADLVERMTARDRGTEYGLGTELLDVEGEPLVGHTGAVPGFHAVLQVWPARATAVAVLVPSTSGSSLGTGTDAADLAVELHRVVAAGRS